MTSLRAIFEWVRQSHNHKVLNVEAIQQRRDYKMLSAGLVRTWRELAAGREDNARQQLISLWGQDKNGVLNNPEDSALGRVTLRLFERLAPVTDEPATWSSLPRTIDIYAVGDGRSKTDLVWDRDERDVDYYNWEYGIPKTTASVGKSDVLAYLSCGKTPSLGTILAKPENVTIVGCTGP